MNTKNTCLTASTTTIHWPSAISRPGVVVVVGTSWGVTDDSANTAPLVLSVFLFLRSPSRVANDLSRFVVECCIIYHVNTKSTHNPTNKAIYFYDSKIVTTVLIDTPPSICCHPVPITGSICLYIAILASLEYYVLYKTNRPILGVPVKHTMPPQNGTTQPLGASGPERGFILPYPSKMGPGRQTCRRVGGNPHPPPRTAMPA